MPRKRSEQPRYGFYRSTNKSTGITYLYMSLSQWVPEKKQPRIIERHHVGPIDPDGRVCVSNKFIEKFPQYASAEYFLDGKLIDRHAYLEAVSLRETTVDPDLLQYLAPAEKADIDEPLQNNVRHFGAIYALYRLATETGIYRSLKQVFNDDAGLILGLAIYKILTQRSYQCFQEWTLDHLIPFAPSVCSQRISEVLARIDTAKMNRYWQERMLSRRLQRKPGTPDICALDATSISTYSNTIGLAEYGYNKQQETLPQINLTVLCDQETGEVFYAKERHGSIPDVITLTDVMAELQKLDVTGNDIVLVMDRGYMSSTNIEKMLSCDMHFVLGAREHDAAVREQIVKNSAKLHNFAFHEPDNLLMMCTYHDKNWGEGSAVRGRQQFERGVYLHMYRDPVKATAIMSGMAVELKRLQDKLNESTQHCVLDEAEKRLMHQALQKTKKGQWVIKPDFYEQLDKTAGCFALFSDIFSDPRIALQQYRKRNIVEQGFNAHKNTLAGARLRCQQSDYRGSLFVHLIAQSLMMILYHRLYEVRQNSQNISGSKNADLQGNALGMFLMKLNHIKASFNEKGQCWILDQLTKQQRRYFEEILKINLPPRLLRIYG